MDTTPRDPGLDTLSEGTMAGDPMTQFAGWMAQAQERGIPEPTAMVLATTSAEGRPQARTVLLKAHGAEGFTFYTNRTSRKGQDLQAHPRACAVFPWYALGRQVTAEGSVQMLSQAASEPYFRSRPRGSQIGAWVSRQSQVIGSRAELAPIWQAWGIRAQPSNAISSTHTALVVLVDKQGQEVGSYAGAIPISVPALAADIRTLTG